MEIQFTEEQNLLRDSVYKWAVNELGPIAEKVDDEDWMPPDFFCKAGEIGALGVTIDPRYGGSGLEGVSEILAIEQIARISPALALSAEATATMCAGNIQRNGSDHLKEKHLPAMVVGEKVGAIAITEPNAGSDAMSIRTRAERHGDHFILNGTKIFITNGPIADLMLVFAKTEPDRGPLGISAFIVEKEFEGFSASPPIKKAGMRGSPTGELIFDNCKVPAENLVGELNRGVELMTQGLDHERVMVAAIALGSARQALDYSIKYAAQREQFGKKIGEFQMIQAKLAEMYALYEAALGLTYRAAAMVGKSGSGGKGTDLTQLAAAAVLFASEANSKICREAVQIHGGYGYCLEFPVQRLWRDGKLMEIGAGTNEIRKLVIARELLRKGQVS
jgi:isovaleryl-CoA dehydrogenase